MQRCARCTRNLPIDAYHPSKRGKPGTYCRTCCAQYKRERYPRRPRPPRASCAYPGCDKWPSSPKATYCGPEHRPPPSTTYRAVHKQVQNSHGPAANQPCAHCDQPAEHWAYDHADPNEISGTWRGRAVSYSVDPAHYMALCRSCHVRFDARSTDPEPIAMTAW